MGLIYIFFVAFPKASLSHLVFIPNPLFVSQNGMYNLQLSPAFGENYFPSKITSLLIKILPQFSYLCASLRL